MSNLTKAKTRLSKGDCTCVLCKNSSVYVSTERGVKPLMQWLKDGVDLQGYSAADKVVGKATAFLYSLLGVKAVYADVMSQPAIAVLQAANITVEYAVETQAIINRAKTGLCPFEQCVLSVDDASVAKEKIAKKMQEMGIALA